MKKLSAALLGVVIAPLRVIEIAGQNIGRPTEKYPGQQRDYDYTANKIISHFGDRSPSERSRNTCVPYYGAVGQKLDRRLTGKLVVGVHASGNPDDDNPRR